MKRFTLICLICLDFCLCAAFNARAAELPMFTHDFYLANVSQWLNKDITLSVSYIKPPTETGLSVPDMVLLTAHTFHNHQDGGHMTLAAPQAVADRLQQQCGVRIQRNAGFVRTTQIRGTLKEKDGHYYVQVDK